MSEQAPESPPSARVGFALCAAAIFFALGYALPAFAQLPNLFYDPIARGFSFGARPGPLPMGYLGQILYGLVAGLTAGGVTLFAARRRPASDEAIRLATAWTLAALVLVGAYFTWNNWP